MPGDQYHFLQRFASGTCDPGHEAEEHPEQLAVNNCLWLTLVPWQGTPSLAHKRGRRFRPPVFFSTHSLVDVIAVDKDDLYLQLPQLLESLHAQADRSIHHQEREIRSLLFAVIEHAQGDEWHFTAGVETRSKIGHESSQKHLLCFFTALQTKKDPKFI